LAGLSLSPVLQTILASIVSAVVAIGALLSGLELHPKEDAPVTLRGGPKLNPVPLALVVVGIAAGASAGVFARTNEWLGTRVQPAIERWRSTGYSDETLARRIFDGLHRESAGDTKPAEPPEQPEQFNRPGLNAAHDEFCTALNNATDKDIATQLKAAPNSEARAALAGARTPEDAKEQVLKTQCKGR
jgi:hypothetical protein